MNKAKSVEEYIISTPKKVRVKLRKLRAVIKKTAPDAEERISYGMPYYNYKGRLAYLHLSKKHIGLYIPPPVIQEYKKELKGYSTSLSAVRLPIDKQLPVALIQKLLRSRIKKIDAASKNK